MGLDDGCISTLSVLTGLTGIAFTCGTHARGRLLTPAAFERVATLAHLRDLRFDVFFPDPAAFSCCGLSEARAQSARCCEAPSGGRARPFRGLPHARRAPHKAPRLKPCPLHPPQPPQTPPPRQVEHLTKLRRLRSLVLRPPKRDCCSQARVYRRVAQRLCSRVPGDCDIVLIRESRDGGGGGEGGDAHAAGGAVEI